MQCSAAQWTPIPFSGPGQVAGLGALPQRVELPINHRFWPLNGWPASYFCTTLEALGGPIVAAPVGGSSAVSGLQCRGMNCCKIAVRQGWQVGRQGHAAKACTCRSRSGPPRSRASLFSLSRHPSSLWSYLRYLSWDKGEEVVHGDL